MLGFVLITVEQKGLWLLESPGLSILKGLLVLKLSCQLPVWPCTAAPDFSVYQVPRRGLDRAAFCLLSK